MVGVLLLLTVVRIFSQSSYRSVNGYGFTVTHVSIVTRLSIVRPPRHFKYLRVKHARCSSNFNHTTFAAILLLLLCGDIESNPGPDTGKDIIKCVCDSLGETGRMIECEQCLCWSHSDCINIPPHLASSFPFICPHCVKASITLIPTLRSEISHLRARVIKLENANKPSPNPEIMSVHEPSMSLSQHVDSLSCLSNSLPPTNSPIITSSTILSSTNPSVSSVPPVSAVPVSSVPSVPPVLPLPSQHFPSQNSKSSYPPQHFLSHPRPPCKPPFQPFPTLPNLSSIFKTTSSSNSPNSSSSAFSSTYPILLPISSLIKTPSTANSSDPSFPQCLLSRYCSKYQPQCLPSFSSYLTTIVSHCSPLQNSSHSSTQSCSKALPHSAISSSLSFSQSDCTSRFFSSDSIQSSPSSCHMTFSFPHLHSSVPSNLSAFNPNSVPTRSLKILSLNVRSLLPKFDEFCLVCASLSPDIICVSESWLSQDILDHEIALINYQLFRKDRNRHGGGVLLYIHSNIFAVPLVILNCFWFQLKFSTKHLLLVLIIDLPPRLMAFLI